jgi:tetratricopeptide (TPR) repeat protein
MTSMTTKTQGLPAMAAIVAAMAIGLSGCQAISNILPDRSKSNNTAASPFGASEASEPITKKQQADVQMALGRTLERDGNLDEAIKIYEDVVQKDSKRTDVYVRLAVVHDMKGNAAGAEKFYQTALKKDPKNAETRCDLGYSYYLQSRWSEAETSLKKAIELKPNLARAHTNLGLVYARKGENAKALKEFKLAGCSEAESHSNLGYALMLMEQWPEAQREFQQDLDTNPQSKPAQAGLATLRAITSRQTDLASSDGAHAKVAESSQAVFREQSPLVSRSE